MDKINLTWTDKELLNLIKDNLEIFKDMLMEMHYQDHQIKEVLNKKGNKLLLEYKNPKYRHEGDLKINIFDFETILNLGYDSLIYILDKINIQKMDECADNNIEERMLEFMTNVISPIINIDKYKIKITDGSLDEPYYIASFVPLKKYLKNQSYLDKELISFKCASDCKKGYYVVFELSKYPKSFLNLTGEAFYKKNVNSKELFRGIILSYIYFGNNKMAD